jgi:hypothetical protein
MVDTALAQKLEHALPTFVSLAEAARQYGVPKKVLTQQVEAGTLEAVRLTTGEILVAAENGQDQHPPADPRLTKEEILKEKYGHLLGNKLTLTQAAEKYEVPRNTVASWLYISGYLKLVDRDTYPLTVDEAEIAYLVDIYQERQKMGSRAPLLDEAGLPYEIKRPDVAEYRRKKKTQFPI